MVPAWYSTIFFICLVIFLYIEGVDLVVKCIDGEEVNITEPWKIRDYPNPLKNPEKCGRQKDRRTFICDPDNLISRSEADALDELIEHVLLNTTCVCGDACNGTNNGFSISIAFVNRMYYDDEFLIETDKLKIAQKFSNHLRTNAWDFGKCDNDAVILINKEFRKAWTSTGDVFNEHLSDWCVNHIYKEMRFHLKDGNYSLALTKMITSYTEVLQGNLYCKEGVRPGSVIFFLAMGLFASCALIAFASFLKQRFHICEDEPIKVHVEEAA